MSQNVLYYAESADTSDGWQRRLGERGFEVLRTTELEQLPIYAKTRPTVGVILDASLRNSGSEDLARTIRALRDEPATSGIPIIAMFAGIEAFAQVSALAEAGITGFYLRGMPETMLLHFLNSSAAVQSLKSTEESGMTVPKLAAETREKIHDVSQPLAALQGRLQILQSKIEPDHPQKEKIDLMVKLSFEMSTRLRDLQELHRKYS